MRNTMHQSVVSVMSAVQSFSLNPARFLVAWNGVLVLAFDGFPYSIESAKNQLIQKLQVIKENPGSKWPKVTLAALSGRKPMSESDFQVLQTILLRYSEKLKNHPIVFDTASIVHFNCRSLERIQDRFDIPLLQPVKQDRVSAEQKDTVSAIFAESDSPDYFSLACQPGRHIMYYREEQEEWTLVTFVNSALDHEIRSLAEEIDRQLPDLYEWIPTESRHVTILGLAGL